jgi:RNA recognition motif-containing protein
MARKLFVGNIPFTATEQEVAESFTDYGPVHSAIIVKDRETGRSRGFGFVELEDENAESALIGMQGVMLNGRVLRVNTAFERGKKEEPQIW